MQGALLFRDDDNAETAANRIEVYEEQTRPLVDYYKRQEILSSSTERPALKMSLPI